jgi:hypothetical protein
LKALQGYTVLAKDGDIGKVRDFYFHDDTWIVRYLVVDPGHWLPGRNVLITPGAFGTGFNAGLIRNQAWAPMNNSSSKNGPTQEFAQQI